MVFYNNNFYFQYLLFRSLFLGKYNISNIFEIPKLEKLKCSVKLEGLKSLSDPKILKVIEALEKLSNKKPKITKISTGYFKTIESSMRLEVCISNKELWNFLTYYNYFLMPISKVKKISMETKFLENSLLVRIEDISLFVHLEDKYTKDKVALSLDFNLSKNKISGCRFQKALSFLFR